MYTTIEKSKHIKAANAMLAFVIALAAILGIITLIMLHKDAGLAMFVLIVSIVLIVFSFALLIREYTRIKNLYTYGKEYEGTLTVKSPVSDDGGSTYIFSYEENGENKSCQINTGYMTSDMDKKEVIALIYKKAACIKAVKY